jgi:hypothetical protein
MVKRCHPACPRSVPWKRRSTPARQIGEHFGMSQRTAYETVKRAKKKRAGSGQARARRVIGMGSS